MQAFARIQQERFGKILMPRFIAARQRDDELAAKQRLKERWENFAEDGMIAVIREGMDCDCVQYRTVRHIPVPSLAAWLKAEDENQQWLDGPESHYFGRPSDYPIEHVTRDRALEAYEDGHPGYVTWGDL
jgi:hypothetical protein